jgi:cardiolipin synthase A/B
MSDSPAAAPRKRSLGERFFRWLPVVLLLSIGVAILALAWPRAEPQAWYPATYGPGTPQPALGIYITPMDGRAALLDEIDHARESITVQIYLIADDEVIGALAAAAARGVHVRVLLEEHPYGGGGGQPEVFERLRGAGLDVRWGNPVFRFNHVKTMTIDGSVAIVMTHNLTNSSFTQNRGVGIISNRPDQVAQALAIFDADWNRAAEPENGPLVVSPTDSRPELLRLIRGATTTLDIYAEVMRDEEFVEAIADAARRGVAVRIVMSPGDDRQMETLRTLLGRGVEVRLVTDVYIHAKIFLVDRRLAFAGSQNMTSTSLDQNREIGLVIEDPGAVERIGRVFDQDFRLGREVTP